MNRRNIGSAAGAEHIAGEFMKRFKAPYQKNYKARLSSLILTEDQGWIKP